MQRGNSQQKCTPVSRTHPSGLQNIATAQVHSQRSDIEYNMQHEKWDELRHKMKSMRLNKIGVTSYLNKNSKQFQVPDQVRGNQHDYVNGAGNEKILIKSDVKLEVFDKGKDEKKTPVAKNKLELDIDIVPFTTQNKIYTSKNKQKGQNKVKSIIPYTPYFSHAYELQRIRPSTNHSKPKMTSEENPEISCNLQAKGKVKQFEVPGSVELKLKKRKNKLQNERKKIKTSASYYKNNKSMSNKSNTHNDNININLQMNKSKQIFTNDLIQFSKLKPEDYTERTIIRRKSNIVGDCMQAIQASILKGKIILFTTSITSGNANYFAQIKHMPPTGIFNDNCEKCKPVSQMNTKIITHTTTGSYQMRLMIGSTEILEYLELFALSHHPIEMQASITKLGIILVDFLKITEKGLKIDKAEVLAHMKNLSGETKDLAMQQIYKQLKNNQLVRWKNAKKSANRLLHHNLTHDNNVINHQHEPHDSGRHSRASREGEIGYYRVYGQPHPKINSKQYEIIQSSQRNPTIEINNEPITQPSNQANPNLSQTKQQVNNSKVRSEHIDQKISHRQTISILDEAENNSRVLSKSGDIVEEVLV